MVKQFGLPTFLVTLTCTGLWSLQLQWHGGKNGWNDLQSK